VQRFVSSLMDSRTPSPGVAAVSQFVPSSSFPRKRESTPNIAVAFRTRAEKGMVRSMDPRLRGDDGGEHSQETSN